MTASFYQSKKERPNLEILEEAFNIFFPRFLRSIRESLLQYIKINGVPSTANLAVYHHKFKVLLSHHFPFFPTNHLPQPKNADEK
jgi:hypothetical protein